MDGGCLGGRNLSLFHEFSFFPRSSNFSMSLVNYAKFTSLAQSAEFMGSGKPMGSATTAQGLATRLVGREKSCIEYCLFCTFIIIIVAVVNINISFAY